MYVFYIQFVESSFCLRSSAEHSRQCQLLEREDMSATDKQHYSTTFGVNRQALLNSLTYFDVSSGALIPDIMHDILEGALPLEVKLMLKVQLGYNKYDTIVYTVFTIYLQLLCYIGVCCGAKSAHSPKC